MKIEIEAEIVRVQDGHVLVRLKNGHGNPDVWFAKGTFRDLTDHDDSGHPGGY